MAHYAVIDPTTMLVTQVFVGKDETDTSHDWEQYYAPAGMLVRRTSYNTRNNAHTAGGTPFRGNYAGIGFTYDPDADVFIPPKPFASWLWNSAICGWQAPVPRPDGCNNCGWNETLQQWEQADA